MGDVALPRHSDGHRNRRDRQASGTDAKRDLRLRQGRMQPLDCSPAGKTAKKGTGRFGLGLSCGDQEGTPVSAPLPLHAHWARNLDRGRCWRPLRRSRLRRPGSARGGRPPVAFRIRPGHRAQRFSRTATRWRTRGDLGMKSASRSQLKSGKWWRSPHRGCPATAGDPRASRRRGHRSGPRARRRGRAPAARG